MQYNISEKLVNMKPSAIREIFKSLTDPEIIAFAAGNPAPESFPSEKLAELASDIFTNRSSQALQYGITEGYLLLREQVTSRLETRFGIKREGNGVMMVSGGQQGIELTCKVMCNEGDVVLTEDPSFIGALNAFRSNGAKTVGVEMEDDGINVEKLKTAIDNNPRAKILYLIPTFHNPAGTTMSLEKRRAVYEICREKGLLIIEDNPYGELRFAGEDIPTIKSFDDAGIVVYCGSFSKILSAGMRVGFLSAPEAVFQKIVVAKQVEDVHTNQFFQMLCADFITKYGLDEHIAGVSELYRSKCELMLGELDKNMPECVKYTRPEGGLFIWLTLPDHICLNDFVKEALAKKVAVVPGTAFSPEESEISHSFRVTYSTPSCEQIVRGVKIISDIIKEMM
ncbi:MAG: PLP-dependent aminotransferase family protein [Ruminococcaceae bacterium]|nr:PLP-dependent aminotransferase family protein [Oscillospiraceae bacterium]